ncbi:MAG TPA: glycosyltransferase [Gemmatimonadaceae bacterium]|nr:glycosyltransferase [Gemmatimonadaceae bacterium]
MARGGTRNGRSLRLACVASRTPNGHYRVIVPMQEMARRGHTIHWPGDRTFLELRDGAAPPWDAMHIQQMHDEEGLEIMARMRRAGIAVVWDTDDDLSAVTRGSEAWHRHGGRRGIRRHAKQALQAARTAHLVTTTNEHLAQVYREQGVEHVVAVENYIAPEDLERPRKRHQGLVIGLTAAGEHEPDLKRMRFAAMLERLLERHDGVRVVCIGVDLRLRSEHRYTHLDDVRIEDLVAVESEFDVGLAPLRDTAFNRARSNVKLKEYAAAGAMWVASPVGPYRGMGEEQGGVLVCDDDWLETLEALLRDADRRRTLTDRARTWVQGQTIRAGAARWQAAYRDAVERARGEAA